MTRLELTLDELMGDVRFSKACEMLDMAQDDENALSSMWMLTEAAHKYQKQRNGDPYILHPVNVMFRAIRMSGHDIKLHAAALGHDVIEDGRLYSDGGEFWTPVTYEILEYICFSKDTIDTIRCLTRIEGEDEEVYRARVLSDYMACKVKLCDIGHNRDLTRLPFVDTKALARDAKYAVFEERLREHLWNNRQEITL